MYKYELSIIIPHYNSSETLKTLLETIPANKEIEVVVVDDKSESNHIEIIKDMQTSDDYRNFKFLINDKEIKSAGTCRNIGIDHANGKWLFFADADDYFQDNFYECIEPYLDSGNDVIFFSPMSIYLDTKKESTRHVSYQNIIQNYINDKNKKNYLYLKYKMHPPWLKIVKSKLINDYKIRYDEIIASNDVLFSSKVGYFMNNFEISKDTIYIVTRNKGSLSVNYSKNIVESRINAYIEWYIFVKDKLSKQDLEIMDIYGLTILSTALHHSVNMFFKAFYVLGKNKIPIFPLKIISLHYLLPKLYERFSRNMIEKKYKIKS